MTHLTKAIELISESNSANASFNVPVSDNYGDTYKLLIHECNADLINRLVDNGFHLHMTPKGLSIDKY